MSAKLASIIEAAKRMIDENPERFPETEFLPEDTPDIVPDDLKNKEEAYIRGWADRSLIVRQGTKPFVR